MYRKMQASWPTEFIPFICISALWNQSSFLVYHSGWQMTASCFPPAPHNLPGEWRHLLGCRFTSLCKYLYSSSIYRTAQFFQNIYYFDYLAVLGLNHVWGTFDLPCAPEGSFICGIWALRYRIWDLVPWPVIQPRPPALGAWSHTHWTTREVPG